MVDRPNRPETWAIQPQKPSLHSQPMHATDWIRAIGNLLSGVSAVAATLIAVAAARTFIPRELEKFRELEREKVRVQMAQKVIEPFTEFAWALSAFTSPVTTGEGTKGEGMAAVFRERFGKIQPAAIAFQHALTLANVYLNDSASLSLFNEMEGLWKQIALGASLTIQGEGQNIPEWKEDQRKAILRHDDAIALRDRAWNHFGPIARFDRQP